MIDANHAILLSVILFSIGLAGALTRRNLIMIFVSVEIMLNAANLNLVALTRRVGMAAASPVADSVALFVILLAACEVAVGLGLLLLIYRRHGKLDLEDIEEMKE